MPVAETILLYSKNSKARAKVGEICDKAGKTIELQKIMEMHKEYKAY
jgi:hypothetical protein